MQTQPRAATAPADGNPARRRRRLPALGAAVAVAAVATAGILLAANRTDPPGPVAADALDLRLPAGNETSMGMCAPFSVDLLADMSPAFAGTATDVTENRVVLDVDRWYAGGGSDTAVLDVPNGILLAGEIDFREGGRYLVTAAEGTVNLCGFSGAATPELEAAFEQAFRTG